MLLHCDLILTISARPSFHSGPLLRFWGDRGTVWLTRDRWGLCFQGVWRGGKEGLVAGGSEVTVHFFRLKIECLLANREEKEKVHSGKARINRVITKHSG
jgi:hypothetical protein